MKNYTLIVLVPLLIIGLGAAVLLPSVGTWTGFATTTVCGGAYTPGSGDFIVDNEVVTCENENFAVNGNIRVNNSGNLSLINTTLQMDIPIGGNKIIRVDDDANGMYIIDSIIKSDSTREYNFLVQALFVVRGSTIQDIGHQGGGPFMGLTLQTSAVDISDTTIKDSEVGVHINADGITINDITLDNFEADAIRVNSGDNTLIDGCTITNAGRDDVRVTDNSVSDTVEIRSCSFIEENITILSNTSKVKIQWYTDVFVNDSGPVNNSFVNVTDNVNVSVFTGFTGADGWLRGKGVTEKTVEISSSTDWNPHTFMATVGEDEVCTDESITADTDIILQIGQSGGCDIG